MERTVARLHKNGDLEIMGELIKKTTSYDDSMLIDDNHIIDGTILFSEEDKVALFLNHLFDIDHSLIDVDSVGFDGSGNLFAKNIRENDKDVSQIRITNEVTIRGELIEKSNL